MSFIQKNKNFSKEEVKKKKPFYQRRWLKILAGVIGSLIIVSIAFGAYIFATGSKIFVKNNGSILRALTRTSSLQADENGRTNILLIGRGGENHPGGLLTDSIMVVSILPKENKVAMLSIPRDLYVPIQNHGKDKINSAFADGYNDYLATSCKSKKKAADSACADGALVAGANLTKQTVSSILDIPIHYYVMADFEGFKQLIDSIGGVDVNVEKAIYDPFYPDKNMTGYEPFRIKAGQQHLNGEVALKYARSRETSSDFDRAARQQIILSAVKDKVMQLGFLTNPKKLVDLVTIVGNHIRTDFAPDEIKALSDAVKNIDQSTMVKKVLSSGADGLLVDDSSTGTYYLMPKGGNFNQIARYADNIFSQNTDNSITVGKVEIQNGSATPGLGSQVATMLTKEGFNVVSIQTAKEKSQNTIIYDYSKGTMKSLTSALEKKFGVTAIAKTTTSGNNVDVTVIIGQDYKIQ